MLLADDLTAQQFGIKSLLNTFVIHPQGRIAAANAICVLWEASTPTFHVVKGVTCVSREPR
jgi:hypothetical protein